MTVWKYTGKEIVSTINRMKGVGIIDMAPAKIYEQLRDPMFRYKVSMGGGMGVGMVGVGMGGGVGMCTIGS